MGEDRIEDLKDLKDFKNLENLEALEDSEVLENLEDLAEDMIEDEVIQRIQCLLDTRHWSIYKLAKASKLPYSSLNNIFRRNTCPSLPTLEKICRGLNISLSQFFEYKQGPLQNDGLTEGEADLLYSYRSLSRKDKELLKAYIRGLSKK